MNADGPGSRKRLWTKYKLKLLRLPQNSLKLSRPGPSLKLSSRSRNGGRIDRRANSGLAAEAVIGRAGAAPRDAATTGAKAHVPAAIEVGIVGVIVETGAATGRAAGALSTARRKSRSKN